jgi:hypothetical protein
VKDLGIDDLARPMTSAVPAPSPVNEIIVPFYQSDRDVTPYPLPQAWARSFRRHEFAGTRLSARDTPPDSGLVSVKARTEVAVSQSPLVRNGSFGAPRFGFPRSFSAESA